VNRCCGALVVAVVALGSACGRGTPAEPPLAATSTIKDIMDSMVDPSADYLFDAVAQIADENGVREKAPHTNEEWKDARRRAVQLLEAPNLLVMAGRKAARPGERSENPDVELQPEEIQKLIDADRPAFVARARQLQDAGQAALQSIDAKDAKGLFAAAGKLDKACENCHLHYWYPNDQRAQAAYKEANP
jgi:hypothetical protein